MRRRRVDEVPEEQSVVVGTSIRALRLRRGWTQGKLDALMGWLKVSLRRWLSIRLT